MSTSLEQAAKRPGAAAGTAGPHSPAKRLANASLRLVILLLAQYVLGIAYNLYGTAPTPNRKVGIFSSPLIGAHVAVGTALIAGAIYLFVAAIRARLRLGAMISALGLASLVAAWVTGSAFVETGTTGYSMAMGALTAVGLLCYSLNVKLFGAEHEALS